MNNLVDYKENRLELKDIFKIFMNYKWFILSSIFISSLLAGVYLFFEPVTYSSNGSLEVITYDKSNLATDDLLENTFYSMSKEVDKEIEKLKTYKTNKEVIEDMDLTTQIYKEGDYGKKSEIFGDEIPIKITKIKNVKDKIYGKMIKIIPQKNGYYLRIEHSLKEKLLNTLFKKKLVVFDNKRLFSYGEQIVTKYFELSINKIKDFKKPIFFNLHGDSYYIYKNFVTQKLTIEQPNKNAPIIKISYEDNIPERATLYVNKLIDIFIEQGRHNKTKRNENISQFIKEGLKENSKELKKAEKELEKYKIKNKVIKTSFQADLIIKKLSDLEIKISENNFREIMVNNIINSLHRDEDFNSIVYILKSLNATVTIDYILSLHKLRVEENKLSSEYTDEYSQLIRLRQEISNIKKNIYSSINSLKSSILYKKINLNKLKQEKEFEFKQLPSDETNIVNLDRKYKVLLNMNDYLLQKDKENNIVKAAIISDYNIVEKSYLPKVPIKPKRSLIQILALLLGFVIGAILSLIHSNLSNKIIDREDIERYTTLELSGIIPFSKKYKNGNIGVFEHPQSPFSESFRKLRTDLQFASSSNKSNIFLVTSMLLKEGKSIVLSNLSAIFQLAGYKIIVIDLDLRNPSLHKYFEIDYSSGISDYLGGRADISDIVFPTAYPNLDIIPAGSIPTNPSELILSDRLEIMFKKLKEKYDYILIDSAPIGIATDTLTLMKYSNINLVIIRKDYSKKSSISKLEKMIAKYNLKNIKLVMNASKENEKY
jgi:capsular exopolysaccharide synthesis family protein